MRGRDIVAEIALRHQRGARVSDLADEYADWGFTERDIRVLLWLESEDQT